MSVLEDLENYLKEIVVRKLSLTEFGTLSKGRQQDILARLKEAEVELVEELAVVLSRTINRVAVRAPENPGQWDDGDHAVCFGGSQIFPGEPGPQDNRE